MPGKPKPIEILGILENILYYFIALILVGVAFYMLVSASAELVNNLTSIPYHQFVLKLLEELLLVMMLVEILHTVTISISQHILIADPFLAVAIIALVRRMLVITVEIEQTKRTDPLLHALLWEVGVTAGAVLLLTVSIYLLRSRREREIPCESSPKSN